jgi:[acyl-carrier-protein] S-malonyltransferase
MSLGFVFPGQGSQSVGMLRELLDSHALVADCFADADRVLGLPLTKIVRDGPELELNRTEITQPAILTASVALWRLWRDLGGASPSVMAGHSLGEYSALVCAGAFAFEDAVALVHERGRLMQKAAPAGTGAMAAILGLDDAAVTACCTGIAGVVEPANFNAPGQVVIAGEVAAVEAAIEACQRAGAKRAMKLAVSVPSHCELMRGAATVFTDSINQVALRLPTIPVVHNVDASVSTNIEEMRQRLVRQLCEPVRWTECVQHMVKLGVGRLVECGPGRVLAGLVKRIDRQIDASGFDSAATLTTALDVKSS